MKDAADASQLMLASPGSHCVLAASRFAPTTSGPICCTTTLVLLPPPYPREYQQIPPPLPQSPNMCYGLREATERLTSQREVLDYLIPWVDYFHKQRGELHRGGNFHRALETSLPWHESPLFMQIHFTALPCFRDDAQSRASDSVTMLVLTVSNKHLQDSFSEANPFYWKTRVFYKMPDTRETNTFETQK